MAAMQRKRTFGLSIDFHSGIKNPVIGTGLCEELPIIRIAYALSNKGILMPIFVDASVISPLSIDFAL